MMKVLMMSAEVSPFAKVGGLADVAGSLPKALAARGVDIRVITPKYRSTVQAGQPLQRALESVMVPMPTYMTGCALDVANLPGTDVPCYFVEHNHYFDRDSVYGTGGGFPDNFLHLGPDVLGVELGRTRLRTLDVVFAVGAGQDPAVFREDPGLAARGPHVESQKAHRAASRGRSRDAVPASSTPSRRYHVARS